MRLLSQTFFNKPASFTAPPFREQLAAESIPAPLPLYSCVVNKFFSVSALLVGAASLAFVGYALFRYLVPKAPASPIVLFASYDSGVAGTMLEFRADGTFRYENAAFISSDVVTGHYTQTDSLIRLDQLPKTGLLKSTSLLVRYSPKHDALHTGKSLWQLNQAGRVDSSWVHFTVYNLVALPAAN